MDLATLLVVNALTFLVLLLWLKRKVDRELSADRALEKVRKEVGDLITELNATTERNITLIEDRVKRLNELFEQTDRKIGLLRKESEKHDVSTAVYNDLIERRRDSARRNASETGGEERDLAGSRGPLGVGSSDSSGASAEYGVAADSNAGKGAGQSGDSAGSGETTDRSRGTGLRNRVRDLHRAGFAAESIAHKVGSTIGEVELIIGLEGGNYANTEQEHSNDGKQES